ncbi:unnamed protein product, partial [Amoebophrya sp. A25]
RAFLQYGKKTASFRRFVECGGCGGEFDYGNCIVTRNDGISEFAGKSERSLNWQTGLSTKDIQELRKSVWADAQEEDTMARGEQAHTGVDEDDVAALALGLILDSAPLVEKSPKQGASARAFLPDARSLVRDKLNSETTTSDDRSG